MDLLHKCHVLATSLPALLWGPPPYTNYPKLVSRMAAKHAVQEKEYVRLLKLKTTRAVKTERKTVDRLRQAAA